MFSTMREKISAISTPREPKPSRENNKKPTLKKPKRNQPVFDLNLIDELEQSYARVVMINTRLLQFAQQRNYPMVTRMLCDFTTALSEHFKHEEQDLYHYLDNVANLRSAAEKKILKKLCAETRDIQFTIISLINQNPFIPVTDNNLEAFIDSFEKISGFLEQRIQLEQRTIFPIYKKSRKVVEIC